MSTTRVIQPMTATDRLLVGSFTTFFVIGCIVDWIKSARREGRTPDSGIMFVCLISFCVLCMLFCPANGGITPKNVHEYNWPPRPVFDVYWWWCEVCDPILLVNPGIWGDLPSPNMWLFTAGYGYYQVFPIIAIARFWHDHPFTINPPCQTKSKSKKGQ